MDTTIYYCIPAGAGARGTTLIFSSAAAGGFIGGLQPVSDGQWSTRLQNAGVGAVVGGVGAPLIGKAVDISRTGMLRLYDLRRARSTIGSGGRLKPSEFVGADHIAEEIYASIRSNNLDISKISQHTGLPEFRIKRIKHRFSQNCNCHN